MANEVDQELVEQSLNDGFVRLRFPAPLEQAFVQARAEDRTFKLILAGLSAVVIFSSILVADVLMTPGQVRLAVTLRIGVFGPVVLVGLWIFHRLSLPQLNEWLVVPVVLMAAGITLYLASTGITPLAYMKVVELIIIVMFVAVFCRFWPMVVLSALVFAMHVATVNRVPDVVGTMRLSTSLLLLNTMVFALYACHRRERNDRLAFLQGLRECALRDTLNAANARLDDLSRTDALTGVANRRAFDTTLAQHAQEGGERPLAMLLIDVDQFKAYNDHYGHPAGDRCLCAVAEAISSCLRRPVDLLARWGGEEFAVLLQDADMGAARQVAERIREAVEHAAVPHAGSSCAPVVTVSVGGAVVRSFQAAQPDILLHRADDALYRAKSMGRNRVVLHTQLRAERAA